MNISTRYDTPKEILVLVVFKKFFYPQTLNQEKENCPEILENLGSLRIVEFVYWVSKSAFVSFFVQKFYWL